MEILTPSAETTRRFLVDLVQVKRDMTGPGLHPGHPDHAGRFLPNSFNLFGSAVRRSGAFSSFGPLCRLRAPRGFPRGWRWWSRSPELHAQHASWWCFVGKGRRRARRGLHLKARWRGFGF